MCDKKKPGAEDELLLFYLLPVHTMGRCHDPSFPDQCSSTEMMIRALRVVLERDLWQESKNILVLQIYLSYALS